MTNERIRVTVDGPSVMAEISLAQVEEYLRRGGWTRDEHIVGRWWHENHALPVVVPTDSIDKYGTTSAVCTLSHVELRPAYEVLRDIAGEVLPAPCQCEAGGFGARER